MFCKLHLHISKQRRIYSPYPTLGFVKHQCLWCVAQRTSGVVLSYVTSTAIKPPSISAYSVSEMSAETLDAREKDPGNQQ